MKRPGAVAVWYPILHKDIVDILRAKDHLQGDHRKHIDCNIGLTVPSIFMEGLKEGNKEYSDLWSLVLETQLKTGSPYIMFEDNVNNQRCTSYIVNNLKITASNICCEVLEYTDPDHTFVCCLCSLNLATWEEWKRWKGTSGKSVAEIAVYLLDAGLDDYIIKASKIPGLENAIRSAQKERSIGVGTMGLAYLYQSKNLPFKSYKARQLNKKIFKQIQEQTTRASVDLGIERGIPQWSVGQRNALTCVEGNTTVLTKEGLKPIKSLVGSSIEVWNGFEWSLVSPFKTQVDAELYKVDLEGGYSLTCTKNHNWIIQNYKNRVKPIKITTEDLKIGDKLAVWNLPIIDGQDKILYPYTSGFFTGDGSYNQSKPKYENCKQRKEIRLYGNKHQCLSNLNIKDNCSVRTMSDNSLRFYVPDEVLDKFNVPSINTKLQDKLQWLAGYFDSDGCVSSTSPTTGQITSINKECLEQVRIMAASCGLYSRLHSTVRRSGFSNKERTINNLCFSGPELLQLNKYTLRVKFKPAKKYVRHKLKVLSITKVNNGDSYCFTDSLNGTGMFNLITTGQCAVAPTRTNSVISGAFSAGIEPNDSNYYVAKQSKGNFIRRNKHLESLLESKSKNTEEVWDSILFKNGSVFHLDFLTFDEKLVFATAREIDQQELIRQASERQEYIDQSQSLNRFYHPNIPAHIINEHIFTAYNNNIKTLYYTRTSSPQQLEPVKGDCYIVTKDDCKYCKELKILLDKVGIKYVEIDKGSIEHFPWRTVPQVWYEGCYIGGYEDMKTLIYNKQSQVPVSTNVETVQSENLNKQDDCKACEA